MKGLNQYRIDIYKLPNKVHEFDFEFDDSFFEYFDESIVEKGRGTCHLDLDKSDSMMTAHFKIDAEVELICDRSLESFMFPIKKEETLMIKFGDEDIELSEEIISIQRDTQQINVAQNIFEYLTVAIPMKRLHPKFNDEDEDETDSLIYSSNEDEEEVDQESIDPRWEALKKLNNK